MTKKSLYISIGTVLGVSGFAAGVAIPIAMRKHEESYNVNINNSNGAHYLVLKVNPQTNKAESADASKGFIWDINSKQSDQKDAIAKLYGIEEVQVIATISSGKSYSNGLEKLIWDLLHIKNNGDNAIITFPVASADGSKTAIISKEFILPNKGSEKLDITSRYDILSDKNSELYKSLISKITLLSLYKKISSKNPSDVENINLTTAQDFDDALTKMYNIIDK